MAESLSLNGIITSNLTIGPHTLYVRMHAADDSPDGIWGAARPLPFDRFFPSPYNLHVTGSKTITNIEYEIYPGEGNAIPLPLPTVSGPLFLGSLKDIPTDQLHPGRYFLKLLAKDSDGF